MSAAVRLALACLLAVGAPGCVEKHCEGSPWGVLRVANAASLASGVYAVGVWVLGPGDVVAAASSAPLAPGESVDFTVLGRVYRVEVVWAGGEHSMYEVEVDDTSDGYDFVFPWEAEDDDEFDELLSQPLPDCSLEVTSLDVVP